MPVWLPIAESIAASTEFQGPPGPMEAAAGNLPAVLSITGRLPRGSRACFQSKQARGYETLAKRMSCVIYTITGTTL